MSETTTRQRPGFVTCLVFGIVAIAIALTIGLAVGDWVWTAGFIALGLFWIGYGFYQRRKR